MQSQLVRILPAHTEDVFIKKNKKKEIMISDNNNL